MLSTLQTAEQHSEELSLQDVEPGHEQDISAALPSHDPSGTPPSRITFYIHISTET